MRMVRRAGMAPAQGKEPRRSRGVPWGLLVICLLAAGLSLALTGCTLWTVQSLHPTPVASGGQVVAPGQPGFVAAAYVDSIWQSKVLPAVQDQATDLPTLLQALKADPEGAKTKYGHREGQRPYNFLVKGQGKVLTVDAASRSRSVKLDLLPGDGQPDATLQVGPVIRGTTLRDALPFIQFNMFTNQIEYADVSNALNDHVIKDAIGTLDVPSLQGKTVDFQGACTLDTTGAVLITPVKLQTK